MSDRFRGTAIVVASTTCALAMLLAMPAAFAQAAPSSVSAPEKAGLTRVPMRENPLNDSRFGPRPTDAELKDFVNAALAVQQIAFQAQSASDAAKSNADRDRLRAQAEAKMDGAMRAHHLTVKRYRQIYQTMRADRALHMRVEEMIGQSRAEHGARGAASTVADPKPAAQPAR